MFSQEDHQQLPVPVICGKAFFSIRNRKYSTALELLRTAEQDDGNSSRTALVLNHVPIVADGYHLVLILKMVCYAHLHLIKETIDITVASKSLQRDRTHLCCLLSTSEIKQYCR